MLNRKKRFFKEFSVEKGYDIVGLVSLGLISGKNQNDIYRSRIIFLSKLSGRTVGFGARVIKVHPNLQNTSIVLTRSYIIRQILYGLYNSKMK